ncbi:hypothetical protein M569_02089, partial [Genlisea aurea]
VEGESPTCLAVYRDGGAPAVFQSPKCPRWSLSRFDSRSLALCQISVLQGRRKSQEDRALCAFDLRIPFLGPTGIKDVKAGIMAIFDGHNGSEASEMASAMLLNYFLLHTYFLLDSMYSTLAMNLLRQFKVRFSSIADGSFPFELLREALLRAINDIDSAFSEELTDDHHPDRDDEKSRIVSSGGYISDWAGVPRVNGELALSRAIGDIKFKSFGVIPVPEVTDWQPLTVNDSFVMVASDGVFEKLSPQEICDILWEPLSGFTRLVKFDSLADCIVNTALDRGSMDNMAAILIPLRGQGSYQEDMDNLGCFYLSEDLNVNDEYTFWIHKDDLQSVSNLSHALSRVYHFSSSGSLGIYSDQHSCLHLGSQVSEDDDRCSHSDGFARFLGLLESIPFHYTGQNERAAFDTRYILKKKFDRGAFGEVWLAFNWNCTQVPKDLKMRKAENVDPANSPQDGDCNVGYSDENMFILKRIMVERGATTYLSGLREKYFGEVFLNASSSLKVSTFPRDPCFFCQTSQLCASCFRNTSEMVDDILGESSTFDDLFFRGESRWDSASNYEEGLHHIARYVESFESQSNEIWLVFRHEGISLSKILYTAEEVVTVSDDQRREHGKRVQILRPSKWWHWLKTTEAGQEEFRSIIWQLLMGLKACHDRGITHRDIKPENMLICFEDRDSGSCLREIPGSNKNYVPKLRIIDFGSALNGFTIKNLYGTTGPSGSEQTSEYAPPEALLNVTWYMQPSSMTSKYDMWSTGVVVLELILGSPHVFQINSKTQALLEQHLKGWTDSLKELAYKIRALMEMCILVSGSSSELQKKNIHQDQGSPVPWKCSEEYFSRLIKSRDPLKLGFPNTQALRLVRDLLQWDPGKRLSVDDALRHPYFT